MWNMPTLKIGKFSFVYFVCALALSSACREPKPVCQLENPFFSRKLQSLQITVKVAHSTCGGVSIMHLFISLLAITMIFIPLWVSMTKDHGKSTQFHYFLFRLSVYLTADQKHGAVPVSFCVQSVVYY
jgi:hypothetical protein